MSTPDFAARRQHWRDFYAAAGQRRMMYRIACCPGLPPRPWPRPELARERLEWAWRLYQLTGESAAWLDDDQIPWLDPFTGTEIFAAAFGCPVESPPDNMPFARPLIASAAELPRLRPPSLDAPPLRQVFAIADELYRRSGRQGLMRLPDIQSPVDIAALIWDKASFFAAMLDEPAAVQDLVAMTAALLQEFLDEWFRRYGTAYVAHYPWYYCEGGLTLSEDEVGAVSPAHFREFFQPSLAALARRYGGLGMHCCANSRHQWANFKALPGLRVLNLAQPAPVARAAYDAFSPEVVNYHHGWQPEGPPWTWLEQLPANARAIFEIPAADRVQAVELAARLAAAYR